MIHTSASSALSSGSTPRLLEVNGRWLASADTPDGPTLGCGSSQNGGPWLALEPFSDVVDELLASVEAG